MSSFRVGLIGYGLSGSCFHAPFISATPGLELAAIVTANPERQAQVRREYPRVVVCSSPDDLWRLSRDLHLIVVATPNAQHVPLARAAVRAGLPVVVDKPLAASAVEARALVDEARRAGVLLTVFQNRRFDGDFMTLHRLLGNGELGAPLRFESRFERWRPQPRPGFRESGAAEDAGGLLFDLGSHLIDQSIQLFGPPSHVYAEVECRRPGAVVDDDVFVALWHDGVRAHLWMSAVAAAPGPRFRLLGSKGAYVKFGMDVQEAALRAGARPDDGPAWGEEPESAWGVRSQGDESRAVRTLPGDYGQFYRQVAAALRGERRPPVNPDDAVRVLEIIQAARRSAEAQRVVRLEKR